jgi:hypothetical protein
MIRAYGTSPVHLVDLVCLVYLVELVHLVSFVQPKKPDRPDKPNNGLRMLAGFFSILLYLHPRNFFIGRHQLVPDLHHQLEGHIGFL